jgi:PDZ domain
VKVCFGLILATTIWPLALSAQSSSPPSLPNASGLYVLVNDKYQEMLPAPIQAIRPKVGRAILNAYSLGMAGYRIVITIPGNTSPIQTNVRPTFVLVNIASAIRSTVQPGGLNPRALEIVRLDRKKNRRESNIVHGTTWNMSIGLPDAKWPFIITPLGDSVYKLTLSSDLPQGEYVILSEIMANGYNGFDFTVVLNAKRTDSGTTSAVASTPVAAARIAPPQVSPISPPGGGAPENRSSSQVTGNSVPPSGILGVAGADWQEGGVRGVQIVDVFENGSGQLARLHKGDVITHINDKSVGSTQDLENVLSTLGPGTRVSISYLIKTNLGWMPKETAAILAKRD